MGSHGTGSFENEAGGPHGNVLCKREASSDWRTTIGGLRGTFPKCRARTSLGHGASCGADAGRLLSAPSDWRSQKDYEEDTNHAAQIADYSSPRYLSIRWDRVVTGCSW